MYMSSFFFFFFLAIKEAGFFLNAFVVKESSTFSMDHFFEIFIKIFQRVNELQAKYHLSRYFASFTKFYKFCGPGFEAFVTQRL